MMFKLDVVYQGEVAYVRVREDMGDDRRTGEHSRDR